MGFYVKLLQIVNSNTCFVNQAVDAFNKLSLSLSREYIIGNRASCKLDNRRCVSELLATNLS